MMALEKATTRTKATNSAHRDEGSTIFSNSNRRVMEEEGEGEVGDELVHEMISAFSPELCIREGTTEGTGSVPPAITTVYWPMPPPPSALPTTTGAWPEGTLPQPPSTLLPAHLCDLCGVKSCKTSQALASHKKKCKKVQVSKSGLNTHSLIP